MQNDTSALPATPPEDGPLRCDEVTTEAAWKALEGPFRLLYGRSTGATLYSSWEWLETWWSTFRGQALRLFVLAFYRGERLVGCAPLVSVRPGRLPLRRLELMGVLRSDYLDFVLEDGQEKFVLEAFERHLQNSRRWDLLDLQQLPEDSPTLAFLRQRQPALQCAIRLQEVCPYISLPADWKTFLAGLGKKNRYNVGYYKRLMERDFKVNLRRAEPEDLEDSMDDLFRLHQLRWRKRKLPGALFSSKVRLFHRTVAKALLECGKLDLYRLDLDGRAVALLYCFAENGRGYYYLGGFDPEFSRYSAGTVLTAHAIEQSILRGDAIFDFLRGDEAYKYRWNVQEKRNYRVEWRRGTLRSSLLFGLNGLTRAVERKAKQIAHRLEKNG